jgi:hypothetical protein
MPSGASLPYLPACLSDYQVSLNICQDREACCCFATAIVLLLPPPGCYLNCSVCCVHILCVLRLLNSAVVSVVSVCVPGVGGDPCRSVCSPGVGVNLGLCKPNISLQRQMQLEWGAAHQCMP